MPHRSIALLLLTVLCAARPAMGEEPLPAIKPELEPVKPAGETKPKPVTSGWGVATEETTETPAPGPKLETPAGDPEPKPPAETPVPAAEAREPELSPALAEAVANEKRLRGAKDQAKVKHADILAAFKKVTEREAENAEAWYRQGLAQARSGQPKEGLASLEKALLLSPENPRYLSDKGTVALYAGDLTLALEACAHAVELEPGSALYRNALANVFMQGGEFARAAEQYRHAIKKEPNNSRYIHNLARCMLAAGMAKEALQPLDEVIRLDSEAATAYNDRGTAYYRLGNREKALESFKNAVRINPDYAEAHHNLALFYADDRDPRYAMRFEALDHAKAACKLTNNRNPVYLMGLAEAHRANHDLERAILAAKTAIALDPNPYNLSQLRRFEKIKRDGYTDDIKMPGRE